jgi:hypothetical protein
MGKRHEHEEIASFLDPSHDMIALLKSDIELTRFKRFELFRGESGKRHGYGHALLQKQFLFLRDIKGPGIDAFRDNGKPYTLRR